MALRSVAALLALASFASARAQTSPPAAPEPRDCGIAALQICAEHVLQDETGIVTSPLHITPRDLFWVVPIAAGTAVALHYDPQAAADLAGHPHRESQFSKFSSYTGLYGPAAAAGAGYVAGAVTHHDLLRHTGVLAAEAMADGLILEKPLAYAIDRERPNQANGQGRFWPHGTRTWPDGQSMPSEHAVNAWAFAHVVAGQYNGWLTRLSVYSLASAVSVSRVIARDHFPSDVVVGSALGYFVGGYVVHRRGDFGSLALSSVQTPNGRGVEISYNFRH